MLRLLLPASPSREDGAANCYAWINADQAEIENWFMMRVAHACAASIAEHPACTSSLDGVSFWDGQHVLVDVVSLEEDEDIDEVQWIESEVDYTEMQGMRVVAMRIHVDGEGIYWSWWAKHSDIRYTSSKLPWAKIEGAGEGSG